jgi:ribosomal protein L37AE/L43A
MSRSLWQCRHPACPVRGGAILGRITADQGLVLAPDVKHFAIYLDTRRAEISCPACGSMREFRGSAVHRN